MIAEMMLFAKPPRLDPRPTDLYELIQQVVSELKPLASQQGTDIAVDSSSNPDEALTIYCDSDHLSEAVRAMCTNSLEALISGGWIELSVTTDSEPDCNGTQWATIRVSDNGPGIPPELARHIFDPFFSGREAGRGLGLGLSKCWRIVTEHGGSIKVDSQPRRGTTFTIRLPRTVDSVVIEKSKAVSAANVI